MKKKPILKIRSWMQSKPYGCWYLILAFAVASPFYVAGTIAAFAIFPDAGPLFALACILVLIVSMTLSGMILFKLEFDYWCWWE